EEIRITQVFQYKVEHESASSLIFDAPPELHSTGQLDFEFDGQSLAPTILAADHAPGAIARVEVRLPTPQIGRFEVTLHSRIPRSAGEASSGSVLNVPLVMPIGAAIEGNHLSIEGEMATSLEPVNDDWTAVDEPSGAANGARPVVRLAANQATPGVTL